MSVFSQLKQSDGTLVDFERTPEAPVKRPSRWALSNWPVRWKVFAIVLVPLILAATFGGLRVYTSATAESDLRRAADRAEMVPAIENYMAALERAMLASSTDGDIQGALNQFDGSRRDLQRRLDGTDIAPDVRQGVTTMTNGGQVLVEKVTSNSIGLREGIQAYALLLLTAEGAITGSVRVDDERIRAETLGLSRAVGARGQMMMQQLARQPRRRAARARVADRGDHARGHRVVDAVRDEPGARRRIAGSPEVAGRVRQADGADVRSQRCRWSTIPTCCASVQATDQVARQVIERTTSAVTSAVRDRADAQRSDGDPRLGHRRRRGPDRAAHRDPGGPLAGPPAAHAARQRPQGRA